MKTPELWHKVRVIAENIQGWESRPNAISILAEALLEIHQRLEKAEHEKG